MDYELIEAYCNGQLKGNELEAFEKDLENNPELQKEVKFFKENISLLSEGIQNEDKRETLKKSLDEIGGRYFEKPKKNTIIPIKRYIAIAASIAALFILGTLLWPSSSMYEQYAMHAPYSFQQKGDSFNDLISAAKAFNAKDYKTACSHFENYLKENAQDKEAYFALGICHLEMNQEQKALEIFDSELFKNSVFEGKAQWYKALSYLKMEDYQSCIMVLERIKSDSPYYDKSLSLLKELKQLAL